MFKIVPVLYQPSSTPRAAEAELAQIRFNNAKNLTNQAIVSKQELALANAELSKAHAKVKLAQARAELATLKRSLSTASSIASTNRRAASSKGDILSTLAGNSADVGVLQHAGGSIPRTTSPR